MTTKLPVSPNRSNHMKRFKQLQDHLEGVADVCYLYAQGKFCYVTLTFKPKPSRRTGGKRKGKGK